MRQTSQSDIHEKRRLTRSTTPCNRYTFFPLWSTWDGLFTSRQELAARVAAVVAAGVREMPFYGSRSFCWCDERIEECRRFPLHLVILIWVDSCKKRIALIFKRPRIGRMTAVQSKIFTLLRDYLNFGTFSFS